MSCDLLCVFWASGKANPRKVLYFDSDIWILQPLTRILEALDDYHLVITPHATEPFPLDGRRLDERDILMAGQFNFGFMGLSKSQSTSQWLQIWNERLRYYAFAIPKQNWGNLIPSYFSPREYLILRDPRYNVAYWNLHYRGKHLHMIDERVMYGSEPVASFCLRWFFILGLTFWYLLGNMFYFFLGFLSKSKVVFMHFAGISNLKRPGRSYSCWRIAGVTGGNLKIGCLLLSTPQHLNKVPKEMGPRRYLSASEP